MERVELGSEIQFVDSWETTRSRFKSPRVYLYCLSNPETSDLTNEEQRRSEMGSAPTTLASLIYNTETRGAHVSQDLHFYRSINLDAIVCQNM